MRGPCALRALFVAVAVSLALTSPLFAVAKAWTGATNNLWNTATNWNPNGVPVAADDVTLGSGSNKAISLDVNATMHNLTVNATGYSLTSAVAQTLTIGGSLQVSGVGLGVAAPTVFTAAGIDVVVGILGSLVVNQPITAPNGLFQVNNDGVCTFSSVTGSTVTFVKGGTATLTVTGSSTFTGSTTVNAGILEIDNAASLGNASNTVLVASGATLRPFFVAGAIPYALTLNGDGFAVLGALSGYSAAIETWSGPVTLASATTITSQQQTLELSGVVSGSGALTVAGPGNSVRFSGTNTYTGPTTVNSAILDVRNSSGLGSSSSVTVASGAQLQINGSLTLNRPLTINGSGISNDGALLANSGNSTWSGPITLNVTEVGVNTGLTLTLSGTVTGPVGPAGVLAKVGGGTLVLAAANTFSGTAVSTGTLDVTNSGAVTGQGLFISPNAQLRLDGGVSINPASVTLNGGAGSGVIFSNTGTNVINASSMTISGSNLINVKGPVFPDAPLTINAPIDGTGSILKQGSGTLTLAGANTYSGGTTFNAGTLYVNGSIGALSYSGILGTVLGGNGTIGDLTGASDGAIAPGASNNAIGILNTGNLSLASTQSVNIQINGNVAGTTYDRINVTGTVSLNNATLNITSTTRSLNSSYTIIQNDGNEAITGTFNGLSQGSIVVGSNGARYQINYFGPPGGNSVVLTEVGTVWTGQGVDNNWMTPQNWQGNLQPAAGDDLVFGLCLPVPCFKYVLVNNFPAGTSFHSITFADGYTMNGNAITLSSGLSGGTQQISPNATVSMPITLSAPQTFAFSGYFLSFSLPPIGTLTLSGGLTLGSNTLTLDPTAAINISGVISGSGGLVKQNTGKVTLAGANTYTGSTTVSAGVLLITNPSALGSSAAGTTVTSGGEIDMQGQILVSEPLTLNGTGAPSVFPIAAPGLGALRSLSSDTTGADNWAGPVTLATSSMLWSNADLMVSGVISGSSALTTSGPGRTALSGNNTYSGQTVVNSGTLKVQSSSGLGTGDGTGATGTIVNGGAVLTVAASVANEYVSLASSTLAYDGPAVTWGGPVATTGSGTLSFTGQTAFEAVTISGPFIGNALTVSNGYFILTGANSYSGPTQINGGFLEIASPTSSAFTVAATGNLNLASTVGQVNATGGTVTAEHIGAGPAIGTVNGSLTLDATSRFFADFGPPSTYSQIHVNGTVSLGGSAFVGNFPFTPVTAAYIIIDNDGSDPVSGTFSGLPEGGIGTDPFFGRKYKVSYVGGTGNDVVIKTDATTPTANAQSLSTPQNAALPITLTATDADDTSFTFALVSQPSHGTLTGFNAATGAVTYTPTTGYSGSDAFTFTAADALNTSSAGTITLNVIPAPTILSFNPTTGPSSTSVIITGTNFTGATLVTFNGVSASFVVDNASQITATVPPAALSGAIAVTTPGGTATSSTSFTVVGGFDPNGDNSITVADVFYLINYLFAGGPPLVHSGDANGDANLSVADIFYLINYLFAGGPAPQ